MPVRVLIDFHHGLGDHAQFSVVLKHLRKYRPDWIVDVRCGRGKHTGLIGLCNAVTHDQDRDPPGPYQTRVQVAFYENFNNYTDRPCSKVTNCLAEQFGLQWDRTLGRYEIATNPGAIERASGYLSSIGAVRNERGQFQVVLIHYQGNTSPAKKNLAHWQAREFIDAVQACGRIPVILDWDKRSPHPNGTTVFCPDAKNAIWGGFGSGDAAVIAALIQQAEAYIGIDSGPGKIASATNTPTAIAWVKHHPIQFHDPAPNTTHLIPQDWRELPPCNGRKGVQDFFTNNYLWRPYNGEHGLVDVVKDWLQTVLHAQPSSGDGTVKFVLPSGIGDTVWALHKIRAIAGSNPIDIVICGDPGRVVDQRSLPFLRRFPFIRSVEVLDIPVLVNREQATNSRGRYVYKADGVDGGYHYLIPNAVLESGRRLEEWLPTYPVDWNIIDTFDWKNTEKGRDLGRAIKPFAALYLGPESGNVDEGHNRGFIWEPKHWISLAQSFIDRGLNICVVGAPYDRSFYERYVRDGVGEAGMHWLDLIGHLEIGETLALLREAKVFVSYQCGLGIMAHYLGTPTVMWWRADGDSCHRERLVCFDDRMKDSWTNPKYEHLYMGLIYGRELPRHIIARIDEKGWLK